MAHTKSQKSSTDSSGRRLGVKRFDGEIANSGNILVRQRGLKKKPGINVLVGKDDILFSIIKGKVKFELKGTRKFEYVNVLSI